MKSIIQKALLLLVLVGSCNVFAQIRINELDSDTPSVDDKEIIELKSVEKVSPVHKKQLLTYLRLTNLKVGYLLNFGDYLMKDGISRIINGRLQA